VTSSKCPVSLTPPLTLCGRIREADEMQPHAVLEVLEPFVVVQASGEPRQDIPRDDAAAVVVERAVGELQHFGFLVKALGLTICAFSTIAPGGVTNGNLALRTTAVLVAS